MNQKKIRLIIFAKAPVAGFAKTRLIPLLGKKGSAALAKKLLLTTIEQGVLADFSALELCVVPDPGDAIWQAFDIDAAIEKTSQGDGDLGERLGRATERAMAQGESVLLIGTDCPQLTSACLQEAANSLTTFDAVIIPATDGGYTLLGLNRFHPSLFKNIEWSTSSVCETTLSVLKNLQWRTHVFAPLHDIDEPGDLVWLPAHWPEAKIN